MCLNDVRPLHIYISLSFKWRQTIAYFYITVFLNYTGFAQLGKIREVFSCSAEVRIFLTNSGNFLNFLIFWNLVLVWWNLNGTVIQIEKALINDRWRVSKGSSKFRIPTIYNLTVIFSWNFLSSLKVPYFLTVSVVFSVYKQNFTAQ